MQAGLGMLAEGRIAERGTEAELRAAGGRDAHLPTCSAASPRPRSPTTSDAGGAIGPRRNTMQQC